MKEKISPEEVPATAVAVMDDVEGRTDVVRAADISSQMAIGQVSGDLEKRDILIPRLSIVQRVGDLSAVFDGGDLVLNKETVIGAVDTDIFLTVLSIAKSYEERLPFDPNGPRPRKFDTLAEVKAAGLSVDYKPGTDAPPTAREVANILVMLEKPKDLVSSAFPLEYKGKQYAVALWTCRSTAYTRAAKRVFSAAAIELKNHGLLAGRWKLRTENEKLGGNWVFVPMLRLLDGYNDEEFIQFVRMSL